MNRAHTAVVAAMVLACLIGLAVPVSSQSVTAYEGARLIVGDGRVIENATLVVDGTKVAQAGPVADKSADFIVLDANPLDDISNTRRIQAVVLRGAAVDRAQPVR